VTKVNLIYIYFFVIPIFSYLATYSLINPIRETSFKLGFFDKPDKRKLHTNNIVRLGGIPIFLGFFLGLLLLFLGSFLGLNFNISSEEYNFINKVLIGSSIFFLLGTIDDLFKISPYLRLFVEFLTILILTYKGLIFNRFDFFPFDTTKTIDLGNNLSIFANVIWIAGITNAINWLDGIDALTAIYVPIILSTLLIVSLSKGLILTSITLLILIFCIIGFYKFNKHPAKILIGDGGAYFLGFILSTFSIFLSSNKGDSYSILIPILLLSVPIFDMVFVILKRLFNSKSIFLPDRSHLHHRLQDNGISYQNTLRIIISIVLFTSITSLFFYSFI
jgi:UDP-N-acetylmuramyl pentapeptide phosphotransferase/UDP-N-acetylglucosamine-1-phosphate transferase